MINNNDCDKALETIRLHFINKVIILNKVLKLISVSVQRHSFKYII